MTMVSLDTIVAQATPSGRGGIGVIRLSGPASFVIAEKLVGVIAPLRTATLLPFCINGEVVDEGIVLFFKGPRSFTGEDVVEFQGHGGPVVMEMLQAAMVDLGARIAKPGEFSERAFLNNKLDLVQAESIADLINASTQQAARSAARSLQGAFSNEINNLLELLIQLRLFIESSIDFVDEDIDFIEQHHILDKLKSIQQQLQIIHQTAKQGVLLQSGIQVVIAGEPNAGKSSLLNCLSGRESAIVTAQAGTTRDVLREHIQIDGVPLHIIDTAGLRLTEDLVEQEGVRRAKQAIQEADLILWVYDAKKAQDASLIMPDFPKAIPLIEVRNKLDLVKSTEEVIPYHDGAVVVSISAQNNQHIDHLKSAILNAVGFQTTDASTHIARQRHLDAIQRPARHIQSGLTVYQETNALELLAEELRLAGESLGEITGAFSPDDLLGRIFAEFCIGK